MSEFKENQMSLETVSSALLALEQEYDKPIGKNTPEEKDNMFKNRVNNLLDVFKSRYKIPELIQLTDEHEYDSIAIRVGLPQELQDALLPTELVDKEKMREHGRTYMYLKTGEKKFVTGYYIPGFMKIVKPKIDFEKDVSVDGYWRFFGKLIERNLIPLMPPDDLRSIAPILLKIRDIELDRQHR